MSNEQSNLLLLGIGGGGGRLVAAVRSLYAGDMRVLCMDTDALANREVQLVADVPCILFGAARLSGNGAGGDPMQGREAFRDDEALLKPHLTGVRTAVILTCLGAGTGSGATPEVARMLRVMGITTLCVATRPFRFEGQSRQEVANRMYPQIEEHVDSLAEVRLDDLFAETGLEVIEAANEAADGLLASGVTLLWRMLHHSGFVCSDPERLHGLVTHGGSVRFGSEVVSGDNRAARLTGLLKGNRLLGGREALGKARALLVGILGGGDLRLAEIDDTMKMLREWCHADCHVEVGTVLNPEFDGRIELVVFAFENSALSGVTTEPPVLDLDFIKSKPNRRKKRTTSGESPATPNPLTVEPTLWNDQNLDEPTFVRRKIRLDR